MLVDQFSILTPRFFPNLPPSKFSTLCRSSARAHMCSFVRSGMLWALCDDVWSPLSPFSSPEFRIFLFNLHFFFLLHSQSIPSLSNSTAMYILWHKIKLYYLLSTFWFIIQKIIKIKLKEATHLKQLDCSAPNSCCCLGDPGEWTRLLASSFSYGDTPNPFFFFFLQQDTSQENIKNRTKRWFFHSESSRNLRRKGSCGSKNALEQKECGGGDGNFPSWTLARPIRTAPGGPRMGNVPFLEWQVGMGDFLEVEVTGCNIQLSYFLGLVVLE